MNPQFSYVDYILFCANAARPSDMYTVSANPNFYYMQESVQHDLHASATLVLTMGKGRCIIIYMIQLFLAIGNTEI